MRQTSDLPTASGTAGQANPRVLMPQLIRNKISALITRALIYLNWLQRRGMGTWLLYSTKGNYQRCRGW